MADRKTALKHWNKLVAQAWHDENLAARLQREPREVLKEHGVELPHGTHVTVHRNSEKDYHLVIPSKPAPEIAEITSESSDSDNGYFYSIF